MSWRTGVAAAAEPTETLAHVLLSAVHGGVGGRAGAGAAEAQDQDGRDRDEGGDTSPAGVLSGNRRGAVHDHAEGDIGAWPGPLLGSASQAQQGSPAPRLGRDFEIANVGGPECPAVRKSKRTNRDGQHAEHAFLECGPLAPRDEVSTRSASGPPSLDRDEAAHLAGGPVEASVVIAVLDTERPTGAERVGELALEVGKGAGAIRRRGRVEGHHDHSFLPRWSVREKKLRSRRCIASDSSSSQRNPSPRSRMSRVELSWRMKTHPP